eukprot:TRINITY_DN18325_c0_g1_i1.p1 TRINITY_DN18325_c0_g1~~TRINITY_DN18325_c0_g1_i1.p1  ORF type:complete len:863 (+),score=109.15 TRINITY_DN18325_c0_g1_i1:209-2797(+)
MPRRRGLVVSCSYPQSAYSLDAPDNDAQFYEHLLRSFGFQDLRCLTDRKLGLASSHRRNIRSMVQWLVEDASPGDSLAFVFSGHGVSCTCTNSDRRDDLDNALMCSDLEESFPSNLLFDFELQELFSTLPPGVLLTCIIDAPNGDTMVRLPWFYDAKSGAFVARPKARHSTVWVGDRHRIHASNNHSRSDFTLRGTPPFVAKAGSSRPSGSGSTCELFPGVVAFLICACRSDQVCLEAPVPGGRTFGLFTSSLSAVLQHVLLNEGDRASMSALTYLQLTKAADEELQNRLALAVKGQRGFEQHIMLGCTQDPDCCRFLDPPPQQAPLPRSLKPATAGLTPGHLATLTAGAGGSPRWPNVLVQICRVGPEALSEIAKTHGDGNAVLPSYSRHDPAADALLSCEVLGEFWLPPLAHIFPAAALPGDPPLPPSKVPQKYSPRLRPSTAPKPPRARPGSRHRRVKPLSECVGLRRQLACSVREPAHQQQCYTWGAAFKPERLLSMFGPRLQDGYQAPTSPSRLASNCMGEGPLAAAARQLRRGARGTGTMSDLEFEYFGVRELGLDLATAREVYAECLARNQNRQLGEALPAEALAEVLDTYGAPPARGQSKQDLSFLLEAHLELDWRSTVELGAGAAAGELRVCSAELRQRVQDPLAYTVNSSSFPAVPHSRPDSHGRLPNQPQPQSSILHRGEDANSALVLRFSLCASREVFPEHAEVTPSGMLVTPRAKQASDESFVVSVAPLLRIPHVVLVAPLLRSMSARTGEQFTEMPVPAGTRGEAVPVITCARLCEAQRAALTLPRTGSLTEPAKQQLPKVNHKQVPPLPLNSMHEDAQHNPRNFFLGSANRRLGRTSSDSQLPFPLE